MDQSPVKIGQYVLGKNLGIGAFGKVRLLLFLLPRVIIRHASPAVIRAINCLIVALCTPFDRPGASDKPLLSALIDYQLILYLLFSVIWS